MRENGKTENEEEEGREIKGEKRGEEGERLRRIVELANKIGK